MRKSLFFTIVATMFYFLSSAQNYMLIDTKKILDAIPAYVQTESTLEEQATLYKTKIDEAYASVENQYNKYQLQKRHMTESERETVEDNIIAREKEIADFKNSIFGHDGELMTTRVTLTKPLQDKITKIVQKYAKDNGYDLVLDKSNNSMIFFSTPSVDKTAQIIQLVKDTK